MNELEAIATRYERRKSAVPGALYDPLQLANISIRQEREKLQSMSLGRWLGGRSLRDLSICEIGCGTGGNLLQLIQMGADPERIIANDLLPDRVEMARERLPSSVVFHSGDAREMPLSDGSLDLVVISTVFSSILDSGLRHSLASDVERWLKVGGAVLWYDFTFDNPRNPDVAKVTLSQVKELFPSCTIFARRATLAPPLARRFPRAYGLLNLVPALRTHICALLVRR